MSEEKEPTKTWVVCGQCEEGYSYHDCGEDTCCCLYPEANVVRDTCDGKRGWFIDEWFGGSITQDELDQILMHREELAATKPQKNSPGRPDARA